VEGMYLDYKVTSDGLIYRKGSDMPMKTYSLPTGYKTIGLSMKGWRGSKAVHRIVAETLLPNPNNFSDVDHINGDRSDNRLENLRWVSHGENIRLSYESGRRSAKGMMNARCKITEEQVHEICKLLVLGHKPSEIRDMGHPYIQVRSIKQGKNWSYISKEYGL
jgi:hypothetical protein